MIGLEDDVRISMERAIAFNNMLDELFKPTEAQLWLQRTAAKLERERDPDGDKRKRRDRAVIEVMERDGPDCWFCAKPLNGDVSLEHLQPLALGGKWNLDNLALAHSGCNRAAGHLPRFKKEALREQMRADAETQSQGSAGVPNKQPGSNQ